MRVVAIHAGHGAFGQAVLVRPLEFCPNRRVATGALLVDRGHFPGDQPVGAVAMNGMAGRAAHFVFGVAALDAADVGRLVEVALQAVAIGLGRRHIGGIEDVFLIGRFDVLAARTVAGLAGFAFRTPGAFAYRPAYADFSGTRCRYLRGKSHRFPTRHKVTEPTPPAELERRGLVFEPPPASKGRESLLYLADYWACTASTANCAPAAWHTLQLSPNASVFARKWAASALETWHPLQADEAGRTGFPVTP